LILASSFFPAQQALIFELLDVAADFARDPGVSPEGVREDRGLLARVFVDKTAPPE
jgi:hypothetical protein